MSYAARQNARRAQGSSGVGGILNPVRGPRDAQARKGMTVKDHERANRERLREQQRQNRLKKEADASGGAKPFRMARFDNVKSKVAEQVAAPPASARATPAPAQSPVSAPPARSARPARKQPAAPAKPYISKKIKSKPAVPRAADALPMPVHETRNYININTTKVTRGHTAQPSQRGPRPSKADATLEQHEVGRVPAYILERKAQRAREEEERRAAAADDTPPGMFLLPEAERLETLGDLKESLAVAEKELARMPVIVDTFGLKKKKEALEARLDELQAAVKLFSKDKVYLRAD